MAYDANFLSNIERTKKMLKKTHHKYNKETR